LSLLEEFQVIQTTKSTASLLPLLKTKYGLPLIDLLIASQVMEVNGIIITKDKDFDIISEIKKIII